MEEQTQMEALAPERVALPRPRGRPAGQGRLRGARARAASQAQRRALVEADARRRQRQRSRRSPGRRRRSSTRSPPPARRCSSPAASRSASAGARRSSSPRCARRAPASTRRPTSRSAPRSRSTGSRPTCGSCSRRCRAPTCAQLLEAFFGEGSELWGRFRDAPAAKVYHQAYRHGLLEHTLSVAQAVSAAANFFPGIDRDVAVAGALLHDIGKIEAYNDDPLAIDLTDAGRLQGEIPLGYYKVRRRDRGDPRLRPLPRPGCPPHHPQPSRLARARLAGGPVHPRGGARPHDRQPRRPPRQLRPARARAPRRRLLVGLRPGPLRLRLLRPTRRPAGRRRSRAA